MSKIKGQEVIKMAVIQFTYRVTVKVDDKDLLKLNELHEAVKKLDGDAKLIKTTTAKEKE